MSPSRILFWAHLWAATWATPPAPMIRTLRFIVDNPLIVEIRAALSGQAVDVVVKGKFAHDAHGAIGFLDCNGRHVHTVEPVLLYHGVAARVSDGEAVSDLERSSKAAFAEDISGQAGFAADHILVLALAIAQRCRLAVYQQVEHVGFGGAVYHGQMLAIETDIKHTDLEGCAVAHGGLAWFEVNLDIVFLRKGAQALAEIIYRIVFCRK